MHRDIRPAAEEDLPAILALYARVYPDRRGAGLDRHRAYLQRILMQHPWRTESVRSLIYEDRTGRIIGFMGVMPRPMLIRGRPIRMAVSHHLMVDPAHRTTLAGVSLMKAFLSGEQELSMCEPGGDPVRKLWESLGGTTALLQSLHWTRPLRPAGYLAFALKKRRRLAPIAYAMTPGCWAVDAVTTKIRRGPGLAGEGKHWSTQLSVLQLLECIEEFSRRYSLRPVYDVPALRWLVEILSGKRRWGELRMDMVCNGSGRAPGYYLYYAKPGGVSQVLQIGAHARSIRAVLDQLAHDAWANGSLALSGRLDARYAHEISDRLSYFKYGGNWLLIHTRDPELERSILSGDAFLTRLEGEWWIPFDDGTEHAEG